MEGLKTKKNRKFTETEIYNLEPIVVNLLDPTGKRYLQVRLALEYGNKKLEEVIKKNEPKIVDVIISYLSAKTPEDILQPEAKEIIKKELLEKINKVLGEEIILNIYITQFVME